MQCAYELRQLNTTEDHLSQPSLPVLHTDINSPQAIRSLLFGQRLHPYVPRICALRSAYILSTVEMTRSEKSSHVLPAQPSQLSLITPKVVMFLRAADPTDNFPSHPPATLEDCPAIDRPGLSESS